MCITGPENWWIAKIPSEEGLGIDLGPSQDFAIPKPSSLGIYIPHGKDQAIMNYLN